MIPRASIVAPIRSVVVLYFIISCYSRVRYMPCL